MDVYHIWFDLKPDVSDMDFADDVARYMGHLKDSGEIEGYRLTRRKLGLGHPNLPPWHIIIEFEDMAQMDRAFSQVSTRVDPVERFHQAVNSKITDVFFALYRDFPDPGRQRGEEKF